MHTQTPQIDVASSEYKLVVEWLRPLLPLYVDHGAVPVDLLAGFAGCSIDETLRSVEMAEQFGLLRRTGYVLERYEWTLLCVGGARLAGVKLTRWERPRSGGINHRRKVLEARLQMLRERLDWTWVCEATFREYDNTGLTIPDGVLEKGRERVAIEVELSNKRGGPFGERLGRLCSEFGWVIYLCSAETRARVARFQASGQFQNLEVRPLPGETLEVSTWSISWEAYDPTPLGSDLLEVINEEGYYFEPQLSRVLRKDPSEVASALTELERFGCVRRDLEQGNDYGWVCCNYRGAARSGTGFDPRKLPGPGGRVKKVVLIEVRLDVESRWSDAVWKPKRRVFSESESTQPSDAPDAAVKHDGRWYAVIVLEGRPKSISDMAELWSRWEKEYAGVLCYRVRNLARWVDKFIGEHGWDWVEVRDFPKPPESAPYKSLEDSWSNGTEPVHLSEDELSLLRLVSAEGLVWTRQLPGLLGCDAPAAGLLIESLLESKCLYRVLEREWEGGWIKCGVRGNCLAGMGFVSLKVPGKGGLEQRVKLMDIRCALMDDPSFVSWTTRRELAKGLTKYARAAHAAVVLGETSYGLGIFSWSHRKSDLMLLVSGWDKQFDKVRCYCDADEVERFEGLFLNSEFKAVEVLPLPLSGRSTPVSHASRAWGTPCPLKEKRDSRRAGGVIGLRS